jgi:hypothetical protein
MKRRNFVKTSLLTGTVASLIPQVNQAKANNEVGQAQVLNFMNSGYIP